MNSSDGGRSMPVRKSKTGGGWRRLRRVGAEGGVAEHPLAVGPAGAGRTRPTRGSTDRRLGAHPVVVRVRVGPLLRRHEHRLDPAGSGADLRPSVGPWADATTPVPTSGPVKCATTLRAVTTIPEKPSLDGLEAKWRAAVGRRRHLPLRPHEDPRRGVLHRHAAADGERLAPPGPRVQLHPHRPRRRATSGCAARRSSTRWGGTTTASTSSAACSSSPARSSTPRCRTTPTSGVPRRSIPKARAIAISRPELHRAVRGGRPRVRGGLPRPLGHRRPVRRLGPHVHDDRHQGRRAPRSAGSCGSCSATSPTAPSRPRCGTSTCARRWRRPSSPTRSCPGRTTSSCSTARRARC